MRNLGASPYPSFPSQGQGFFKRHMRRLSSSLPRFATPHHAAIIEKEQAIRRRQLNLGGSLSSRLRRVWFRMGPRLRLRLVIGLVLWLAFHYLYGRKSWTKVITLFLRPC
jgi:mannan polymerase II complex MNN10 subunit